MLDEVFATGMRNPHTFSFAQTQDGQSHLIVTSVGHDNFEEVNIIKKGENYGWGDREGPLVHLPLLGGTNTGVGSLPADEASNGYTFPVAFLGHDQNEQRLAAAGAHVIANGSAELANQYLFADFTTDTRVFHVDFNEMLQQVTKLDPNDPTKDEPSELTWVTPQEVTILFDHDNDDSTTPLVRSSLVDVLDDEPDFQVVLREGNREVTFASVRGLTVNSTC